MITRRPLNILLTISAVTVFSAVLIVEPTRLAIPLIYGVLAILILTVMTASAISHLGLTDRFHVSVHAISGTPGLLLCLVSLLVSLQLVSVWGGTTVHYDVVAGLLPYSDANAYYTGALGLLEGNQMSTFSSRRPLMTGYLATLLRVTGLSLPWTLVALSAITGLLAALAACTVGRLLNTMVALWFVLLLFLFYNGFIGTTLSEHLGLTFGLVGFVLLCHASLRTRLGASFVGGLFFLGLGQSARPGAVFILAAVLLWAWIVSGPALMPRIRTLLSGLAALGAAGAASALVLGLAGVEVGHSYSNFADTMYGLSVGGAGWERAAVEHPELGSLAAPQRATVLYQLALHNIFAEPGGFFGAMGHNIMLFLVTNGGLNVTSGSKAIVLVQLPTLAGLWVCWQHREHAFASLLLLTFTAIVLSSAIVTGDGGMRVFAASVPFSAALAATGLTSISGGGQLRRTATTGVMALICALSGIVILLACIAGGIQNPPAAEMALSNACSTAEEAIRLPRLSRRAVVIDADARLSRSTRQHWRLSDLKTTLKASGLEWPELDWLDLPFAIVAARHRVVVPAAMIHADPPIQSLCATRTENFHVSPSSLTD